MIKPDRFCWHLLHFGLTSMCMLWPIKIAIAEPNWDASSKEIARTWESELKTQFKFKNSGSTTLTIDLVKPSCGCVKASSDKVSYAPGEEGTISASLDGANSYGPLEKKIAVTGTDSKGKFTTILIVKTAALDLVKSDCQTIAWKKGTKLDDRHIQISFYPKSGIYLDRIISSDPRVTADFTPDLDAHTADVTVHVSDSASSYQATLTAMTTLWEGGKQKTLEFRVTIDR